MFREYRLQFFHCPDDFLPVFLGVLPKNVADQRILVRIQNTEYFLSALRQRKNLRPSVPPQRRLLYQPGLDKLFENPAEIPFIDIDRLQDSSCSAVLHVADFMEDANFRKRIWAM